MRSILATEATWKLDSIRKSVLAPCAEPVAVTHDSSPQVVVSSFNDDPDLPPKTRFAGKLADLPEEDLSFLATIEDRNCEAHHKRAYGTD